MVLDPFLGAGSTIVACENLKRHACGVEIDPHYVDVSVRRWQQYTGGIAFLDSDARSFDEIAQNGRACVSDREDPNG
jgi:DNA modification methylase